MSEELGDFLVEAFALMDNLARVLRGTTPLPQEGLRSAKALRTLVTARSIAWLRSARI
jgi:hypothetical protein